MKVARLFIAVWLLFLAIVPSHMPFLADAIAPEPALEAALQSADTSSPDVVRTPQHGFNELAINEHETQSPVAVTKSRAWGKIDFASSRKLTNNVWGAPSGETLKSGVYLNGNENYGWYWSREDPQRNGLTHKPIYPSVRAGASPWEASNCAYFPVKLKDVKSLRFDAVYSYPETPTGSYNLAYDMFLSDRNQPAANPKPKAEVMIWIGGTASQLKIFYKGDFTDGNNNYELYSWVLPDGREYYSFVMKERNRDQARHEVDAKRLLDSLGLDPDWYIHGVELGNEAWNGSGKIEINRFNVCLNGHDT